MTTTRKSILSLAIIASLTLIAAGSAFAWHGGGHNGGHNRNEHGGSYASNLPFNAHGGGHERAADNKAMHEAEMKDPNHKDMDYVAPHKKSSNCDGMTGPHGRHISE